MDGEGVDHAHIGERVWMWNAQGGYGSAGRAFGTAGELIAIAADQAVHLSDALSFAAGACLGVPAMTAYRAVFSDGSVEGQTILVNGAAGAVGHFAVQLAAAGGARVIGTVGSPASAAHAKTAGASATVDAGMVIKRFMPAARGSAHPIHKGTSHIKVVLAETTTLQK